MPEGDTVHKLAAVVRQEVEGHSLTDCYLRGIHESEKLVGSRVDSVEVIGKHMLLHLDVSLFIRVHLGMHGSWHRYKPGQAWKRPKSSAAVILKTESVVLVCFNAMDLEVVRSGQRGWHTRLNSLGPDLLSENEHEWQKVLERFRNLRSPTDTLGESLLDQKVVCGIGNVYKSELAFLGPLEKDPFIPAQLGISPWRPLSEITDEEMIGIYRRARLLMQANLGGWMRTTTVDRRVCAGPRQGNLHIYGLVGNPCRRCRGRIRKGQQGLQNRVTYWCPDCQR